MNQINLFESFPALISEETAYELIFPIFEEVLAQNNLPTEILSLSRNKFYSSVMFSSSLVCRLCMRGNYNYFSVAAIYQDRLADCVQITTDPKDKKFILIPLSPNNSITEYGNFLAEVLQAVIDKLPRDFDCCSRYLECSDAKRCITPNKELALGCGYRKILKSGRIFYGKNRNV